MTRYRPPQTPGSKYITLAGYQKLESELNYLWKVKRPAVTQSVREAAAQGDRSENAEYIYGKKQLREIDSRVRFLRKRLDGMKVVDNLPSDTGKVYFGAWICLEDAQGSRQRYRIVGPDEIGDEPDYISMDSPLAMALIGKRQDDEIVVATPAGMSNYTIIEVSYTP